MPATKNIPLLWKCYNSFNLTLPNNLWLILTIRTLATKDPEMAASTWSDHEMSNKILKTTPIFRTGYNQWHIVIVMVTPCIKNPDLIVIAIWRLKERALQSQWRHTKINRIVAIITSLTVKITCWTAIKTLFKGTTKSSKSLT
jgi:hypothetical protein